MLACVREDERAGPVSALGLTGLEAGLGEKRRLLVHHETGDWQRIAEGAGLSDRGVTVDDRGLSVWIKFEHRARLGGPARVFEVQKQRARSCRRVGNESPGETLVQPR